MTTELVAIFSMGIFMLLAANLAVEHAHNTKDKLVSFGMVLAASAFNIATAIELLSRSNFALQLNLQ